VDYDDIRDVNQKDKWRREIELKGEGGVWETKFWRGGTRKMSGGVWGVVLRRLVSLEFRRPRGRSQNKDKSKKGLEERRTKKTRKNF